MKKILFLIFALLISASTINWEFPLCNIDTIKLAFAPKIFQQTTTDGAGQNVLLTRFFHNKVGIYGAESAKCYFNSLDPSIIYKNLGFLTLVFLMSLLYYTVQKRHWLLAACFLVVPLLPVFKIHPAVFVIIYKIFAIIGLAFFLKLK